MATLKREAGGIRMVKIWDTLLNSQWQGVAHDATSTILFHLYNENRRIFDHLKALSAGELRQQPLP